MNKINPISYFPNPADGRPVSGGKLYIGEPDTDPEVTLNQKQVYALQENGSSVAISQPIYLSNGGTPVYNGANVTLYVSGDYAIKILTSTDSQVFYIPDSSADLSNEQGVYSTVAQMIASSPTVGALYKTKGYYAPGDGGGATYLIVAGNSGDGYINHNVGGNTAILQVLSLSSKQAGATGDGISDDTLPLKAFFDSGYSSLVLSDGTYLISDSLQDGTPVLVSAVVGRVISGEGVITANSIVKVAIEISGDSSVCSLNIDGNRWIGNAIKVVGDNCVIKGCNIHDLDGQDHYSAIAVRADFLNNDYSIAIFDNIISDLYAVGDGVGGNGIGLVRAVSISATSPITRKSFVSGNKIYNIGGEEGDCIVVINSNGAGTYYSLPIDISNNSIDIFTRRGVKIQASSTNIFCNSFSNNLSVDPGSLQGVIDLVQGSGHKVVGNLLTSCKFSSQIKEIATSSLYSDIIISDNIISGLGAETSQSILAVQTGGTDIQINNNTINCPNFTGTAVYAPSNQDMLICNNFINTNNAAWFNLTSSTGTRMFGNMMPADKNSSYLQYFDVDSSEVVTDLGAGRTFTLYNRDTSISDGEEVAKIACKQNDVSNPNKVQASINFIGAGTTGLLHLIFNTGDDTPSLKIDSTGDISLLRNGTGVTLLDSVGVSNKLTVDTSGRLLINGVIVGTQS